MNRRQKAVEKTFNATCLLLTFQTRPTLKPTVKEQLPSPTSSMCIYTFDCSCGVSYVGRTTRQLSKRIREHIPTWFGKGQQKSINSSILAHLVDTNHQVDTQKAFKVIYRIPSKLPRGLRVRLLHTAEAVGIRLLKPDLCIQKICAGSCTSLARENLVQFPILYTHICVYITDFILFCCILFYIIFYPI